MRNIAEKRIDWKIQAAKMTRDNLKECIALKKEEIEYELSRFNEMTSPKRLAQYAADMEKAQQDLERLYEQKRWLEFLLDDEGGDEDEK